MGHITPSRTRAGYYHPKTLEDGVMPLDRFPAAHRARIEAAVLRETPPPRWIGGELFQMESRAWWEWHWNRGLRLRKDPDYTPRGRAHIPDSVRFAVYERDGWKCLHCGAVANLSLDHIHPHSLGGSDDMDNLQTLCRSCNSRKGARV